MAQTKQAAAVATAAFIHIYIRINGSCLLSAHKHTRSWRTSISTYVDSEPATKWLLVSAGITSYIIHIGMYRKGLSIEGSVSVLFWLLKHKKSMLLFHSKGSMNVAANGKSALLAVNAPWRMRFKSTECGTSDEKQTNQHASDTHIYFFPTWAFFSISRPLFLCVNDIRHKRERERVVCMSENWCFMFFSHSRVTANLPA